MPWNVWHPKRLGRVERVLRTSMDTVAVTTDAGRAYVKAIGNREGEHALACELIGSSLAEWLGLATLDFSLLWIDASQDDVPLEEDEAVPVARRRRARPGPAFATRAIHANTWSGDPASLAGLCNPGHVAGLVLLDSWLGNPDRHPRRPVNHSVSLWTKPNRDNVLVQFGARGKRTLIAMDFSKCLYCREGGLRASYDDAQIRDDGVYGLFPAFESFMVPSRFGTFLDRLGAAYAVRQGVAEVVSRIPAEWSVDAHTRESVVHLLCARASYLHDNFSQNLQRVLQQDQEPL